MTSILYIGMDVHTTNYTLCAYCMENRYYSPSEQRIAIKRGTN